MGCDIGFGCTKLISGIAVVVVTVAGRTGVHGRPPLPALVPALCLPVGGGNNAFGPLGMGESSIISSSSSSLYSGEVPLEEDDMEAEAEAEGVDGHPYACGSSTGDVHWGCLCIDEVGTLEGENVS